MKTPNRHRTGTLLAIALLLAAMTTGYISICDVFLFGEPEPGSTIYVTVPAGEIARDITGTDSGFYYRFGLCGPATPPDGVYPRIRRELGTFGDVVTVDLVTSSSTPPGHYVLNYSEGDLNLFGPWFATGELDLTVEAPETQLTACFYYYSEVELIRVGSPVTFMAHCSLATPGNPIVQYKWWFNYNGNTSSSPSTTTTQNQVEYTYATAGQRDVRLVVRAEDGSEAAVINSITVQNLSVQP